MEGPVNMGVLANRSKTQQILDKLKVDPVSDG
jgi:hypothetical protein